MTDISEFAEFVHGQLTDLGEVSHGRFFGGVGFKLGNVQFAMCMSDTLYFVVDGTTRAQYVALGAKPFQYGTANGTRLVQRYYEVPGDVLEDRDALTTWAQAAVSIAMRPKKTRKPTAKKTKNAKPETKRKAR